MSEAITPLEAVEMNESYQELMEVIIHCLSCLDMVVIDFNDPINDNNYTVGRDFTELELSVALNELRAKGWQVEKIKNNIYQFTAAPIATVVPIASSTKPLSPQECSERTDAEVVDSIVAIINLQLGNRRKTKVTSTIYRAPLLCNYDSDTLNLAMKKFEEIGWSVAGSPDNDWYFQKL